MSSLINSVEVDFSASEVEKVRRLGVVPQFFRGDAAPLLAANQYMRARSRNLSEKSLRTEAEHIKEMLSWMLSTGMEIADIDEDLFDNYVEALCLYQKSNGDSLSLNTVNARVGGAYRFLAWASTNRFCPDLQQNEARDVADSAKGRYKSLNHLSRPISEPVKFLLMEDALTQIAIWEAEAAYYRRDNERLQRKIDRLKDDMDMEV